MSTQTLSRKTLAMINATPLRSTSIQVTRTESDLGRHVAEDMHGFECFIDAESSIESEISLGMILHADIDQSGRVVRGRSSALARA